MNKKIIMIVISLILACAILVSGCAKNADLPAVPVSPEPGIDDASLAKLPDAYDLPENEGLKKEGLAGDGLGISADLTKETFEKVLGGKYESTEPGHYVMDLGVNGYSVLMATNVNNTYLVDMTVQAYGFALSDQAYSVMDKFANALAGEPIREQLETFMREVIEDGIPDAEDDSMRGKEFRSRLPLGKLYVYLVYSYDDSTVSLVWSVPSQTGQ